MKNAILGCFLFLTLLYALLMQSIQYTEQVKIQEINSVAEHSIQNAMVYMYNSNNEEIADIENVLISSAKQRFSSRGDLTVEILELDTQNGVIKVRYTSRWIQYNGKEKSKSIIKTMIIDERKGN